jgi:hypothetical protein
MESESKVEVTSEVKVDVDTIIDSKIKTSNKVEKIAILSYSGGIVSSTYLLELLGSGYDKVYALFFDYDNKYPIQKQSADEVVKYLETIPGISDKLEYNKLSVKISERSSTTYKRTNTTPRTIKIGNKLYADVTDETVSGRVFAFHQNGLVDPIKYANESGVMTWAEVVTYFGGTSTTDDLGNVVLSEIDVVDIADIPASSEQPKVEGEIVVPFQPENPNKKNYTQVTIIN